MRKEKECSGFGWKLRMLRLAAGETQKDAGAAIGAAPCTISRLEKGGRGVSLETVRKLGAHYGLGQDGIRELSRLAAMCGGAVEIKVGGLGAEQAEAAISAADGIPKMDARACMALTKMMEGMHG